MDPDGLPMIGSGVDFTQVGAIHQKRTLAFINYFVTSTVSFLNNFSRSCEVRLQKCESRIQKLEASIGILEAKLTSVPGLEEVTSMTDSPLSVDVAPNSVPEVALSAPPMNEQAPSSSEKLSPPPNAELSGIPAKADPVFKRFFRMIQVGVPEPAVRLKMQAEGLDPNILSNPEQLVPLRNDQPEAEGALQEEASDSNTD